MYILAFHPDVAKDLKRLDRPTRERILRKLEWLCEHADVLRHEPLAAQWHGFFKLRVGDHRVVYEVDAKHKRIVVYAVGHRREIYDRV